MKILQIVPSYKPAYTYGGPIESVSKLCEGLVEHGHQVDVFTTTANGEAELNVSPGVSLEVDGVNVTYFRRITKDPTHASPALWKHLADTVKSYDIVHIQSWWSILVIVSAIICKVKGVKVVVSPRGMLSKYIFSSGRSFIKRFIHQTFGKTLLSNTHLHATASSEYEECRSLIKDWKGFVVPNVLTLPYVKLEKRENEMFTVIFMSRIHPKKRIELLFEAIADLKFPVRLKIAGTGEDSYISELKLLASKLGIVDKLEWLGWVSRDEKFNLLMHADLFALVSYNENFANVVVESLYVGTPVLLSHGVALSEFVLQQDMGWVSNLEVSEVINNLIEIRANASKRNRINEKGRQIIDKFFAPEKLIAEYSNEYQKIIDSN